MQNTTYLIFKGKKFFFLLTVLFLGQFVMAQKEMPKRAFEISLEADEKIETEIKTNGRFDANTGFPVALYGLNYDVPQGTPQSMAMHYLQNESKALGIPKEELTNLQHHATRTTNAGSVVRYRQYSGAYPVNKNEVTISISPQNKVVFVMNSYQSDVNISNLQPSISENAAYIMASDYLNIQSAVSYRDSQLMIYKNSKITKLAHEVTISTTNPLGEWHVFIDATNGEIFKVVDMNHYSGKDKHRHDANCEHNKVLEYGPFTNEEMERRATGTGFVFDPDPLSSNTVSYGGQYVDGNDATNASLDAARFSVTLNDITQVGSTYSLVGPRAEIIDFDAPTTGLFSQNSSDFSFNRQDQGFEAVNTYYHIDYMMNYVNNTLGCDVMPYQYATGVRYDPHGAGGADNSYYQPAAGRLSFGEGCVDDAEDSDVIHHELGHGLHDWVTAGGGSGAEGLGEGIGDYVAQSYNRGISIANGYWTSADPAWNYVFNWDGHNVCWPGRTTAYGATYPGGLVGQIHTDGQIWATCLMGVWDQIGQQEMDKIFWEGLGMTAGTTGQNDAANAVYQAAINLAYTGAQLNQIHAALTACGYTLPVLAGPPVAAIGSDETEVCLDNNNTVNFTDESVSAPAATAWSWTFEGGTPATSTDQNPVVTYSVEGTYDVTLMVTNNDGSDTITETDYISVVSGAGCSGCTTFASAQNLDLAIPDGAGGNGNPGAVLTHVINVPTDVVIDYISVNVDISHTWLADLIITITHPNGTSAVVVWNRSCAAASTGLDVTFSDGEAAIVCAASTDGTYAPQNPLSAFSGLSSTGDWTISITDNWDQDTGTLTDWSIEICSEPTASVDENSFDVFAIYPNPNNGQFTLSLNSTSNDDIGVTVFDIRGRSVYNNAFNNTADFSQVINLNNVQSGMYLVKVSDGDKQTIKKIIVE